MRSSQYHRCRYQAFSELIVMMIPIMMIFLGLWFMVSVGSDKVRLFLDSRGETEEKSQFAAEVIGRSHITGWDYGTDKIPFTADDEVIDGNDDSTAIFQETLNTENLPVSTVAPYLKTNMQTLIVGPVFAMGAELIEVEKTKLMLENEGNDRAHLVDVFRQLFGSNIDQQIKESALIPATSR